MNIKYYTYQKKEGTKTSYLKIKGDSDLPNRISFDLENEFRPIKKVGIAQSLIKVADLKTKFTKKENSKYKLFHPFVFSSSIWKYSGSLNPDWLLGYGDVGITNQNKRTRSTKDLILVSLEDNKVHLILIQGMVHKLDEAIQHISPFNAERA